MGVVNVGIGEWAVSSVPGEILKTYALGSCVAVCIFDVQKRIAGLIHVALPDSSIDQAKTRATPGYFADSGLPLMIEEMKSKGASRPHVWVKMAGGASVLDNCGMFDIGRRNALAVKRILWRSTLELVAEDVGGSISRTISFAVDSGELVVSSGNEKWKL